MIGIDGKEKPVFSEGEWVHFNFDNKTKGTGKIRGRSTDEKAMPVDFWIVEMITSENVDKNYYPYSCIVVPHTSLQRV